MIRRHKPLREGMAGKGQSGGEKTGEYGGRGLTEGEEMQKITPAAKW